MLGGALNLLVVAEKEALRGTKVASNNNATRGEQVQVAEKEALRGTIVASNNNAARGEQWERPMVVAEKEALRGTKVASNNNATRGEQWERPMVTRLLVLRAEGVMGWVGWVRVRSDESVRKSKVRNRRRVRTPKPNAKTIARNSHGPGEASGSSTIAQERSGMAERKITNWTTHCFIS